MKSVRVNNGCEMPVTSASEKCFSRILPALESVKEETQWSAFAGVRWQFAAHSGSAPVSPGSLASPERLRQNTDSLLIDTYVHA
jgi:hypothetical protein